MSTPEFEDVFLAEIRHRKRVWWGPLGPRARLHRFRELSQQRSPEDADARWQCCPFWQRTLTNKLNGRAFAQRHGVVVPELFGASRRVARLPLGTLPSDFVVKPSVGHASKGVHLVAGGRVLNSGRRFRPERLRYALRRAHGPVSLFPIMIEERVQDEDGVPGPPRDFKFYVFGQTIGAVEVRCTRGQRSRFALHHADWKVFERPWFKPFLPSMEPGPPPSCLGAMKEKALKLARAYGRTFVRVDMYAGSRGPVFGEFSGTPGWSRYNSPNLLRHFGRLLLEAEAVVNDS